MSTTTKSPPGVDFSGPFLLGQLHREVVWNIIALKDPTSKQCPYLCKEEMPEHVTMIYAKRYFTNDGDMMGFTWEQDGITKPEDVSWCSRIPPDESPDFSPNKIWTTIDKNDENKVIVDEEVDTAKSNWQLWHEFLVS